jgi:hypothetical protein
MVCQSPISKKKRVSFNENVRARNALHINDYSEEERHATWLNAADMKRIRREIRYTVQMMIMGGTIGGQDEYSRRGLEYMLCEAFQIRCDNRSAAVRAVLNEQYRQDAGHFLDEQELANVYKVCATPCQITAHLSALSGVRFARLLDGEEDNTPLKNKKLHPDSISSSGQSVPRGRLLRRIFKRRQTPRLMFGTAA